MLFPCSFIKDHLTIHNFLALSLPAENLRVSQILPILDIFSPET